MDFTVEPEEVALRSAVSAITSSFGIDYYVEKAATASFTGELWQELGKAGYVGVSIPEEFGGGGGGISDLAAVCEETAAAGCPLLLLLVASAISGEVIAEFGTAAQRDLWLPRLASGTGLIVFAITEPDAGSNAHRIATTAQRDGDEYVLRGTKHFISGIDVADAVLVVARTGTSENGRGELSLFIVDTDEPGLTAERMRVGVALPERQYRLHFDEVRVSADRLVGVEGAGFSQVFHGLNPERIAGAALLLGIGRYALAKASTYASMRTVWDAPIGSYQGVAHPLAQAKIELEAAAMLTARAAWLHDHRLPAGEMANMAKYAAAEAALAAIDASIQCHGGAGVDADAGLVQLWGLARVLRIAPVNREMILNFVAQHSLGLPRSY